MAQVPYSTLRVTTAEAKCTVVFEPWGSDYELTADDEVLVHLFEGAKRPEDADVEVTHQPGVDPLVAPGQIPGME